MTTKIKYILNMIIVGVAVLVLHNALAATVKSCIDMQKQNSVRAGNVCMTTNNFKFEKIKDSKGRMGWKDLATSVVWYDKVEVNANHKEATSYCGDKGLALPNEKEMDLAIKHHVREAQSVLGATIWGNRTLFWTRDLRPDDSNWALGYYETGKKDYSFRENRGLNSAALCISK